MRNNDLGCVRILPLSVRGAGPASHSIERILEDRGARLEHRAFGGSGVRTRWWSGSWFSPPTRALVSLRDGEGGHVVRCSGLSAEGLGLVTLDGQGIW